MISHDSLKKWEIVTNFVSFSEYLHFTMETYMIEVGIFNDIDPS